MAILLDELPKKSINGGLEANIYKYSRNELLKIYFVDFIKKHGISENKLDALIERRNNVKLSGLPIDKVYYRDRLSGVLIPYVKYSISLGKIEHFISIKQYLDYCKQLLVILKELGDNYIYYTDIHDGNIMVNMKKKVKLIDLDNLSVSVFDKENEEYNRCMYFDLYIFMKDHFLIHPLNIYGLPNGFVNSVKNEYMSYELMKDLINELDPKVISLANEGDSRAYSLLK